jgi:hypothetical protein
MLTELDVIYYDHNYVSGITTPSDYGPMVHGSGEVSYMKDEVAPGFAKKRRQGQIVMNDMESERHILEYPRSYYNARNYTYDIGGSLISDVGAYLSEDVSGAEHVGPRFFVNRSTGEKGSLMASLPSPSMPTADQVLTKAVANAAETDALALVTMAEAKKTVASIKAASNVYHRIYQYMSRLKKSDFTPSGALRHVGTGLAIWLEVRYGLLPLYYEIGGYANIARNIGKKNRTRFTSRAEGQVTVDPVVEDSVSTFYTERKTTKRVRRRWIQAGILVEPVAQNVEAITSLGIDRVASSAWELVPFSFICDWFFNTSQVIAAHEGRFTMRDLGTWVTTIETVISEFSLTTQGRDWVDMGPQRRYVGVYNREFSCREEYRFTVRKANPKVPLLPSFQLRLDWKKCLDLAAISGQVLSGIARARR